MEAMAQLKSSVFPFKMVDFPYINLQSICSMYGRFTEKTVSFWGVHGAKDNMIGHGPLEPGLCSVARLKACAPFSVPKEAWEVEMVMSGDIPVM